MIFERVFVLSLLLAFEVSVLAAQPTYILSFSQLSGNNQRIKAACAPSLDAARKIIKDLPENCYIPSCKRCYTFAVLGMAGKFSDDDLANIDMCIPGGIQDKELDGVVSQPEPRTFTYSQPINQDQTFTSSSASASAGSGASASSSFGGFASAMSSSGGAYASAGGRRRLRDSYLTSSFGDILQAAQGTPPPSTGAPAPQMGLGVEQLSDALNKEISVNTGTENITKIPTPWTVTASSSASTTTNKPLVDSAALNGGNGEDASTKGIKVQLLPSSGGLWNLDRIDQRELPLDNQYRYGNLNTDGTGHGVSIYVLDSGIMTSHREFLSWRDGRKRATFGEDFIGDFSATSAQQDCDGHGTHVASIAAGRSVGVAKEANVIAVRVLDCNGTGTISDTIAGLDWLAENVQYPAVAVLSLGVTSGQWSKVLETTVRAVITELNVSVVVAAGNSKLNACQIAPANVGEVISVAATNLPTKFNTTSYMDPETLYSWNNYGSCIDILAPGVDIYAACGGAGRCAQVNDSAYTWGTGTSMAAPHVAGVAAIYLADHPNATPAEVKSAIIVASTKDKIAHSQIDQKPGTPNRLLYSMVGGNDLVLAQVVASYFGPPGP